MYAYPVTVVAVVWERARLLAYHRTHADPDTQHVCVQAYVCVLKNPVAFSEDLFLIEKMWFW